NGDRLERDEVAERDGTEAAQHEEGAMREVDHAERAEHQGEAEGDQRVSAALVQPVEQLGQERVHLFFLGWGCPEASGPRRRGDAGVRTISTGSVRKGPAPRQRWPDRR